MEGGKIACSAFNELLRLRGVRALWTYGIRSTRTTITAIGASMWYTARYVLPCALTAFGSNLLVRSTRRAPPILVPLATLLALVRYFPKMLDVALVFPAALVEGIGPVAALERSRALMHNRRRSFAAYSGFLGVLVYGAKALVANLALTPLQALSTSEAATLAPITGLAASIAAICVLSAQWLVLDVGSSFIAPITFYHAVSEEEEQGRRVGEARPS